MKFGTEQIALFLKKMGKKKLQNKADDRASMRTNVHTSDHTNERANERPNEASERANERATDRGEHSTGSTGHPTLGGQSTQVLCSTPLDMDIYLP